MAGKHVAVWPKVRVTVKGKSKVIARGDLVPAGVSDVDLDNLVTFGAIAGVSGVEPEAEPSGSDSGAKEPTVPEILEGVGDDKEKAAAVLEQEKAGKNRKTLVEPLEAILAKD